MQSLLLHSHPSTPCPAVQQIKSTVDTEPNGTATITYNLSGRLDELRIPDPTDTGSGDLWQHTCFELFLCATNDAEYFEFNFSPSGSWTLYAFRGYRDGKRIHVEGVEPKINVQKDGDDLQLSAKLPLHHMPGIQSGVQLTLGVAAVIEELGGALSYWALKHPPGQPDFHHQDNFVLEMAFPMVDGGAIDYSPKT